jgi:hypothetical protein
MKPVLDCMPPRPRPRSFVAASHRILAGVPGNQTDSPDHVSASRVAADIISLERTAVNRKPATFRERWRVTALFVCVALATVLTATAIDQQRFLDHIKVLSSDELQGRGNGTPGLDRAADYIGSTFRASGLQPGGDAGSYFQTFEIVTGLQVGSLNSLVLTGPGGRRTLELGRDYFPLSIGSSTPQGAAAGQATGPQPGQAGALPVVFAGYGISAPGLDYDDYSGVDVGGKAVLIFTHACSKASR